MAPLRGLGQPFGSGSQLINVGAPVGIGQALASQQQGINQLGAGLGSFLGQRRQSQLEDADRALLGQALAPQGGGEVTANSLSQALEGFQSRKFRDIADQLISQQLSRQLDPLAQQQRQATLGKTLAETGAIQAGPQQPGFTLTPGAERFGPGGERIARVPPSAPSPVRGVPFTTPEGKTVFVDPTTGRQIPTDLPTGATSPLRPLTSVTVGEGRKTQNVLTLRREFSADQRVKGSRTAEDFFRTIDVAFKRSLTAKNLGPVDIALGKGFQKLTDIMSSVREGEFKTTFDGLSLLNKLRGKFEAITKGGLGFTQEDRKEIRDLSELFVIEQRRAFNEAHQEFSVTADELGLSKTAIFGGKKSFDIPTSQLQSPTGGQQIIPLSPTEEARRQELLRKAGR